jgi:hypothetical protein
MSPLEPGMLVEVWRTKVVSEVCVVEHVRPLVLRPATAWERWGLWFRQRKTKSGEIAAAAEATKAIETAMEKVKE